MHIPIARPSIKPVSRCRLFAEFTHDKPSSAADTIARDSAVVGSLALQHGVPVDVLRNALLRRSGSSRDARQPRLALHASTTSVAFVQPRANT